MENFLIVGLGNPGEKYAKNRHNAGFMVLDKFADSKKLSWVYEKKFDAQMIKFSTASAQIFLLKPQSFMNNSGASVGAIARFYKIENLLVAHDELDLGFGAVKFKFGGSSGGHNGLKSIDSEIGADYFRMRVGIGRGADLTSGASGLDSSGKGGANGSADSEKNGANGVKNGVDSENSESKNKFHAQLKQSAVINRVLSDFSESEVAILNDTISHCANALDFLIQNLAQNLSPSFDRAKTLQSLQNLWTKKA